MGSKIEMSKKEWSQILNALENRMIRFQCLSEDETSDEEFIEYARETIETCKTLYTKIETLANLGEK